jgi:hypothetical protein
MTTTQLSNQHLALAKRRKNSWEILKATQAPPDHPWTRNG